MPGPDFYSYCNTDQQFLLRFIDHHNTPKTKHINKYEAARLYDIAVSLEGTDT